jgi:hypothetical protein
MHSRRRLIARRRQDRKKAVKSHGNSADFGLCTDAASDFTQYSLQSLRRIHASGGLCNPWGQNSAALNQIPAQSAAMRRPPAENRAARN